MFSWFRKSGDVNVDHKINKINDHIKNSFGLVKKDIQEMGAWVKELHTKHDTHSSRADHHERRLQQIEKQLEQLYLMFDNKEERMQEVEIEDPAEEEYFDFSQVAKSFSSLRSTEKEVFKKLSKLTDEKGKSIHLKDLAAEVYPGKDYEKVRTALANHITALEIFDFVYRQRVGREVYIALTEKGKQFVSQIDSEIKKASRKVYSKAKSKR